MNAPTPRTDAHQQAMESEDFDVELAKTYTLARRLESERDELRDELNETQRQLRVIKGMLHAATAERDEARAEVAKLKANNRYQRGYHDGELSKSNELAEMREAIREAHEALDDMRWSAKPSRRDHPTMFAAWEKAESALAKLQPFTHSAPATSPETT